jgi:NAD(P)-dependent dehydrogenase (short-subunit alcohol dehydrogenase family)
VTDNIAVVTGAGSGIGKATALAFATPPQNSPKGLVASDAERVGSSGESIYAGAKGGVIALTKSLAREMARHGINVNCVCPGVLPILRCFMPRPTS